MDLFRENPCQLLPYDGSAMLHFDVWESADSARLQSQLRDEIRWEQVRVNVFNRMVDQPRLTAWYGDEGKTYSYSGTFLTPMPWTETLATMRETVARISGSMFNSVLANLYRDGNDGVGWHADNERELGTNPVIASVSLGATRRFDLKHRDTGELVRVDLPDGSLLVMSGETQHKWVHRIAKTKKMCGERINLTFREIHV